jgi:uncharacterized phage-associated protein
MAYSPATVANYFLDKASIEGRAVTPMQLLKLVYIAHGWHLGYLDTPLINETVQAWKYGPVIKSLYDKIKHYGSGAVREPVQTGALPWIRESKVDETTASLLDHVWMNYAGYSGTQLSAMTHQNETPWSIAWHQQGGYREYFAEIDDELIKQHYRAKIDRERAHA